MSHRALNPDQFKAYTKHYNRGFRAQEGALERADTKGEPGSWYDGYMDNATGRGKFHSRDHDPSHCWCNGTCNHPEPGCGPD